MERIAVGSVERLQRLERCLCSPWHAPYLPRRLSRVLKRVGKDRELGRCCAAPARSPDQFPHEVVQSRAKVVDAVTYGRADPCRAAAIALRPKDVLVGCTVELAWNEIRVRPDELLNCGLDRVEVDVRPCELELRTIEGVNHDESRTSRIEPQVCGGGDV